MRNPSNIEALSPEEMGAPPCDKVTKGGRANPPGISYLYTADDESTAVAEVRPHIGAFVSCAAFAPERKLRIADLTRVEQVHSPFGHDDLAKEIMRCDLLRCLNEELSEPINPERDAIDYAPCQYVVEVIRDSGFDGICYRSAMRKRGFNIVFFRPEDLKIVGKVKLLRVSELEISYEISKPAPGLSL